MTVEQLIEKLMEHPLDWTVKLNETKDVWPIEVTVSHMRKNCILIGENREPTKGGSYEPREGG